MFAKNVEEFFKQPFNSNMNLWGWILFTIIIVTIAFLWYTVIDSFKKVA